MIATALDRKTSWAVASVVLMLMLLLLLGMVRGQGEGEGEREEEGDQGFTLFFQSNREELLHAGLRFHPPLPSWLCGTLVRNGLGLFENGDRTFLHAFDGFAKLSSWSFHGNGSATFSTRFLGSSFYNDSLETGTIAPYLLFEGPTPPFNFYERFEALVRGLDNMNVNVYSFPSDGGGEDYVALSDYWKTYRFSPQDLSTGGSVTALVEGLDGGGVIGASFLDLLSSAHPLPEPGTGHHLTFLSSVSLSPFSKNRVQLVRIRSTLEREVVAAWEVDRIPYMHSFSVTQTHALLLAHPFYVNVLCMVLEATPFNCLEWFQDSPSALYVVELRTGQVTTLSMENVFTMHHINAYNLDPGRIVMDISAYPDPSFVSSLRLSTLRDPVARNSFPAHAHMHRYHIDLDQRTVRRVPVPPPEPAFISYLDMPTLNEHYRSRHYCYVYGLVLKTDNQTLSRIAIVKRDLCGRREDKFWMVPHHYPVEPVFVPHPQGGREDEGVVLVPMIDGPAGRSYMAVLDATDLRVISRAVLPTLLPYSLHGRFFQHVV